MLDAASMNSGWDFWVLALLVALLLPGAVPAKNDTEPPRGKTHFAARSALAAEGAR